MNLGSLIGYLGLDTKDWDKGLDKAEGGIKDFAKRGAVLAAAAGVAIATAVTAAVVQGMNIEAANDKLAAQLGASGQYSADLGKIAGDLYANAYGDSLSSVNNALKSVLQNGLLPEEATNAQIQAITAKVLDLSTAFEVDLGGATNAVGQMLRTGLAKNADEALDIITRGFQQGADKGGDYLDTLNEYSTQFRKMGIDGATATGLISQGLKGGARDSDIVADAIKEFSIRAVDGSKATADGFASIGLSASAMAGRVGEGGERAKDALSIVLDQLRAMPDPVARSQAAVALFGTQAEDLGDALYSLNPESAVQALGNVEGAAKRMGDTLNDNASTALTELKRGVETTAAGLANSLLPAVRDVASWLADNLGPAVKEVTEFLGEHETAAKAVAVGLGTFAGIFLAIAAATKVWAIAQGILNVVLTANPIGLIVIAVAALIAGLIYAYKHSETFRDIVNGAFDAVKQGVGNAIGFMITGFRMLLTVWLTVADGIISGAAKALGWIPGIGDKLKAANKAFDNMKDGILSTLDEAAQKAYGFGEKSGSNAAKGLDSTKQGAFNAGKQVGDDMGRGVGAGSGTAYNAGAGVGSNAAQGLIDGMRSRELAVASQAQRLAITAGRAMQTGLQVHSPSRLTMWMGQMLGQGLIDGMASMRPAVTAEMLRMADTQALSGLAVGQPAWGSSGAGRPTAPALNAALGAGPSALFHADTVNVIEGTPQDIARELSWQYKARG